MEQMMKEIKAVEAQYNDGIITRCQAAFKIAQIATICADTWYEETPRFTALASGKMIGGK